jgi:hypothetical protein
VIVSSDEKAEALELPTLGAQATYDLLTGVTMSKTWSEYLQQVSSGSTRHVTLGAKLWKLEEKDKKHVAQVPVQYV